MNNESTSIPGVKPLDGPGKDSQTLFMGHTLLELESVDSTNNYALSWLASHPGQPPDGTCIIAKQQTAGRGQREARWQSEPGKNLTCSVILLPRFLQAEASYYLSKATALAVHQTILEWLGGSACFQNVAVPAVWIKWPNDILVQQLKIAGILIETQIQGRSLQGAVIGVGINVNQQDFTDLPQAGSLAAISGLEYELAGVRNTFLEFLEARYLQLRQGQFARIDEAYHERLLGWHQSVRFSRRDDSGNSDIQGIIRGVRPDGMLELENPAGAIQAYHPGSIAFQGLLNAEDHADPGH